MICSASSWLPWCSAWCLAVGFGAPPTARLRGSCTCRLYVVLAGGRGPHAKPLWGDDGPPPPAAP